ncbi:MAG TPA: hypothetical protein H9887_03065 [Candidatus Dorea intestinavium]|nr:hypothetical protein [Candidatus Dorea intestinavium]
MDNLNTKINELSIRMFGEFSIKSRHYTLTASKHSGLTSFLLLGYLISNKGNDITGEMLMDVLWPDGESNNPSGALRTLLHRTKKMLDLLRLTKKKTLFYEVIIFIHGIIVLTLT